MSSTFLKRNLSDYFLYIMIPVDLIFIGFCIFLFNQNNFNKIQFFEQSQPITTALVSLIAIGTLICGLKNFFNFHSKSTELNTFFMQANDMMGISTSTSFKKLNPAFLKALGYEEETIFNKNFLDIIHSDDMLRTQKEIQKLNNDNSLLQIENRILCQNGESKTISWSISLDLINNHLYFSGRDISQQKENQETIIQTLIENKKLQLELTQEKNKLLQVLSALNENAIISETDPNGKIIAANKEFCKISGYTQEELVGKNHRIVKSGLESKAFFENIWKKIKEGKTWSGEIRNRSKNGEVYTVSTIIIPLLDDKGQIDRFYSIRFDVTEQKKLFLQLLEAQEIAKIGGWRYDFKSQQQFWTNEYFNIFEIDTLSPPKNLHQYYLEHIHPEDLPSLKTSLLKATQDGKDFNLLHRIIIERGNRIKYVENKAKVTKDAEGNPLYISGTCRDLTEEIENNLKHQFILNSLEIGVWKINLQTLNVDWENSMFQLYEINENEFNGHFADWENLITSASKDLYLKDLEMAIRGEKEFNTTFEICTKRGARKFIGAKGNVIRNMNGEALSISGINWDCTKEVELEMNLMTERSKSFHKSKLASLGEMSAGIAHEINNPLAIIEGTLRLMQKTPNLSEDFKTKFGTIEKSSFRISKIINGLRKFSRTSEKQTFSPHSLRAILNEIISLVDSNLKRNFIPLKLTCETESQIYCNEIEIEQVMMNLINNSIDAIKNTKEPWIQILITESDSEMLLQIKDSGKNLTEEVTEKLFQPFFTTKAVGEGTGLGLSIVKGILDDHNAIIQLNKESVNTCFEIKFKKYKEVKNAA